MYVGIIQQNGTTVKSNAQLQKQRHNCKKYFCLLHCIFYSSTPPTTLVSHAPLHAPCSTKKSGTGKVALETGRTSNGRHIHHATMKHWVAPQRNRSTSMVGCRGYHFLPTIFPWSYIGQLKLPPSFEEGSTWGKSTPILKTLPTLET